MANGNYGQKERNNWCWQYGSKNEKAWEELFHKSGKSGFDETHKILILLLSQAQKFTDDSLRKIRDDFLSSCEASGLYPWRYYYVKYDAFRPGTYGLYSNESNERYMFSVMLGRTRWNSNTYMPYLKEADVANLDSEDTRGERLVYEGRNRYIECSNAAYHLRDVKTGKIVRDFPISQNQKGIDTVDRIILLKKIVSLIKRSIVSIGRFAGRRLVFSRKIKGSATLLCFQLHYVLLHKTHYTCYSIPNN
ncbi:MAG: hypothetical protein IJU76_02390 [Desulfovibrionaceae bacterium]|nr:hypothetical protein [Desulfovibrionaceae bacterium]